MRTILLVGEDLSLLESRAAVLRRTNAGTVNASQYELPVYGSQRFDLLVLCHALRQGDRIAVAELARHQWPGVQILQVLKYEWEQFVTLKYADQFVLACDPGELVQRAAELLDKPLKQIGRPIPKHLSPRANKQSPTNFLR